MEKSKEMAEMIVENCKEKVPIGALLLADDVILPQDLAFALDHQKYSKQLLGQILVNMGAMDKDILDRTLKLQEGSTDKE